MRCAVLGSGSKGNATLVEAGQTLLLIDCGFGPKELRRRMRALDRELCDIDALLVTHGHADHIAGAAKVAGALGRVTYCTDATARFSSTRAGLSNVAPLPVGAPLVVGDVEVRAFPTLHDAPGSVGLTLTDGAVRYGHCTDLGAASADVRAGLSGCDTLLLEFNHDLDMLRTGPYPHRLKRRVMGDRGHLSNRQAGALLAKLVHPGLRRVLLAHLSEVNNTAALARAAALPAVDGGDIEVSIAPQHHPTGWFSVGAVKGPRPRVSRSASPPVSSPPAPHRTLGRRSGGVERAAGEPSIALARKLSLFQGGDG